MATVLMMLLNGSGISAKTLYSWLKKFSKPAKVREEEQDLRAENARLKRELKRLEQERNLLKEAAVFFAGESKNGTGS